MGDMLYGDAIALLKRCRRPAFGDEILLGAMRVVRAVDEAKYAAEDSGKFEMCEECDGTRVATCLACSGTGKCDCTGRWCSRCKGDGCVVCPECAKKPKLPEWNLMTEASARQFIAEHALEEVLR